MAEVFNSRKDMVEAVLKEINQRKDSTDFDSMPFQNFERLYLSLNAAASIMEKENER